MNLVRNSKEFIELRESFSECNTIRSSCNNRYLVLVNDVKTNSCVSVLIPYSHLHVDKIYIIMFILIIRITAKCHAQ